MYRIVDPTRGADAADAAGTEAAASSRTNDVFESVKVNPVAAPAALTIPTALLLPASTAAPRRPVGGAVMAGHRRLHAYRNALASMDGIVMSPSPAAPHGVPPGTAVVAQDPPDADVLKLPVGWPLAGAGLPRPGGNDVVDLQCARRAAAGRRPRTFVSKPPVVTLVNGGGTPDVPRLASPTQRWGADAAARLMVTSPTEPPHRVPHFVDVPRPKKITAATLAVAAQRLSAAQGRAGSPIAVRGGGGGVGHPVRCRGDRNAMATGPVAVFRYRPRASPAASTMPVVTTLDEGTAAAAADAAFVPEVAMPPDTDRSSLADPCSPALPEGLNPLGLPDTTAAVGTPMASHRQLRADYDGLCNEPTRPCGHRGVTTRNAGLLLQPAGPAAGKGGPYVDALEQRVAMLEGALVSTISRAEGRVLLSPLSPDAPDEEAFSPPRFVRPNMSTADAAAAVAAGFNCTAVSAHRRQMSPPQPFSEESAGTPRRRSPARPVDAAVATVSDAGLEASGAAPASAGVTPVPHLSDPSLASPGLVSVAVGASCPTPSVPVGQSAGQSATASCAGAGGAAVPTDQDPSSVAALESPLRAIAAEARHVYHKWVIDHPSSSFPSQSLHTTTAAEELQRHTPIEKSHRHPWVAARDSARRFGGSSQRATVQSVRSRVEQQRFRSGSVATSAAGTAWQTPAAGSLLTGWRTAPRAEAPTMMESTAGDVFAAPMAAGEPGAISLATAQQDPDPWEPGLTVRVSLPFLAANASNAAALADPAARDCGYAATPTDDHTSLAARLGAAGNPGAPTLVMQLTDLDQSADELLRYALAQARVRFPRRWLDYEQRRGGQWAAALPGAVDVAGVFVMLVVETAGGRPAAAAAECGAPDAGSTADGNEASAAAGPTGGVTAGILAALGALAAKHQHAAAVLDPAAVSASGAAATLRDCLPIAQADAARRESGPVVYRLRRALLAAHASSAAAATEERRRAFHPAPEEPSLSTVLDAAVSFDTQTTSTDVPQYISPRLHRREANEPPAVGAGGLFTRPLAAIPPEPAGPAGALAAQLFDVEVIVCERRLVGSLETEPDGAPSVEIVDVTVGNASAIMSCACPSGPNDDGQPTGQQLSPLSRMLNATPADCPSAALSDGIADREASPAVLSTAIKSPSTHPEGIAGNWKVEASMVTAIPSECRRGEPTESLDELAREPVVVTEMTEIEARLRRFFEHHNPGRLATMSGILKQYEGDPEELFAELTKKYGPEPGPVETEKRVAAESTVFDSPGIEPQTASATSGVASPPMPEDSPERPTQLADGEQLAPPAAEFDKAVLANAEQLAPKSAAVDTAASLVDATPGGTVADQSADVSSVAEKAAASTVDMTEARLRRFFEHHNPGRLATMDSILNKYEGRPEELFAELTKKYGPEPPTSAVVLKYTEALPADCLQMDTPPTEHGTSDGRVELVGGDEAADTDSASAPAAKPAAPSTETTEVRLHRFFKHHNPGRLATMDNILKKYEGRPEELFADLKKKYGPEPLA